MKKTKPTLTKKQLFIKDIIDVVEKHEMISIFDGMAVVIHDKNSSDKIEGYIYESLLHALKCTQ